MPEPQSEPPRLSLSEWSFRIRRRHILRAIRNPSLSPAAKQIMVALALRDDDPFILPERPPVGALARHLALAERTVRQAIAELVVENCLTFRTTGEARPARAAEEVWDPAERPDIAREHAFIRAASALPSRAEPSISRCWAACATGRRRRGASPRRSRPSAPWAGRSASASSAAEQMRRHRCPLLRNPSYRSRRRTGSLRR